MPLTLPLSHTRADDLDCLTFMYNISSNTTTLKWKYGFNWVQIRAADAFVSFILKVSPSGRPYLDVLVRCFVFIKWSPFFTQTHNHYFIDGRLSLYQTGVSQLCVLRPELDGVHLGLNGLN